MATREQYKGTLHYANEQHFAEDCSSAPSPFKIDEGFDEETRSQPDAAFGSDPIDMGDAVDDADMESASVTQWVLSRPPLVRASIARDILASLPNSLLSQLVYEASTRLHFDPVRCLPQEIVSSIFELLDPKDLAQASFVSKLWTAHALEPRLWRRFFALEGWTVDREKLRSFEHTSRSPLQALRSDQKARRRSHGSVHSKTDTKRSRRQKTNEADTVPENQRLWVEQHESTDVAQRWQGQRSSNLELQGNWQSPDQPVSPSPQADEEMRDVADDIEPQADNEDHEQTDLASSPESPPSWHHLYKQRRRLEHNWSTGRYTNFRLPHPDFAKEEAHRQCVYALQFTTKHLVSGSRDRTLRIWDLSTQRLKLPPLTGHHGSVLCLQFDESPEQDVIISGGSDSDVIVWKFSTGAMMKRLHSAHTESVLNLRFDNRYLVTCSKDKTIKLWNRKEMRPDDPEYPQTNRSQNAHYPSYIVDMQSELTTGPFDPLEPYTLLTTFDQHNAAVNAIQIFENEIVSASGDRKIMLWDIRTGTLIRTFLGHSKGIACVQYDGRRIISGSSDNSVRIFDSATAAEVAVLDGHENLVRTVQGDFCETGDADYKAEAQENDKRITEEKSRSLATGEAPSLDDHFVYGAKLPPSGGGNRWSKIVSGSYDETVIIWRKDEAGKWYPAKQLRQEDAMRATAPPGEVPQTIPVDIYETRNRLGFVRVFSGPPFSINSTPHHIFQHAQAVGMPPNLSTRDGIAWMQRNLLLSRGTWGYFQFFRMRYWNSQPTQAAALTASLLPPSANPAANPAANGAMNDLTNGMNPGQHQQPQPQNAPPAHFHPNHPHFQYQLAPQMLPNASHRQIPAMPRISAQIRQPQLQIQLHNRLSQHLLATCRDIDLPPGPDNMPTQAASVGPAPPPPPPAGPTGQGPFVESAQASNGARMDTPTPLHNASDAQQLFQSPPPVPPMQAVPTPPNQEQQEQLHGQQPQPQQEQPPQAAQAAAPQPPNPAAAAARAAQAADGGLSRVFKLQFDSRRIICCSQQPIIVGWDFANGDRDIEEASPFFDVGH